MAETQIEDGLAVLLLGLGWKNLGLALNSAGSWGTEVSYMALRVCRWLYLLGLLQLAGQRS